MVEGRQQSEWQHTSNIMALIANVNRDPKKHRAYKPTDFDPFSKKRKQPVVITKDNIGLLKREFVGGNK